MRRGWALCGLAEPLGVGRAGAGPDLAGGQPALELAFGPVHPGVEVALKAVPATGPRADAGEIGELGVFFRLLWLAGLVEHRSGAARKVRVAEEG